MAKSFEFAHVDCERNETPISLALLGRFLWNLRLVQHEELKQGGLLYRLYAVYLLSHIQLRAPEIVVTFVDNNEAFHWIAGQLLHVKFCAVQNGLRNPLELAGTYAAHVRTTKMRIPIFFCFGQADVDAYQHFGHHVGEFRVRGSAFGSEYLKTRGPNSPPTTHDVCLISQWDPSILQEPSARPDFKAGYLKLMDILAAFVAEHPELRFKIALRSTSDEETRFYQERFGSKVSFAPNDRLSFSTYRAIDSSRVAVCLNSTIGLEAFGFGKKVLFCNFTGNEGFSPRRTGFWSMETPSNQGFRASLFALYEMPDNEYAHRSKSDATYLMGYRAGESVFDELRILITRCINHKSAVRLDSRLNEVIHS